MTEHDFREQMIANVATLTEAVDTLKDSVKAMASELHEDDAKGHICRQEVDASITQLRIELEGRINSVKVRAATIGGGLGVSGIVVGLLIAVFLK